MFLLFIVGLVLALIGIYAISQYDGEYGVPMVIAAVIVILYSLLYPIYVDEKHKDNDDAKIATYSEIESKLEASPFNEDNIREAIIYNGHAYIEEELAKYGQEALDERYTDGQININQIQLGYLKENFDDYDIRTLLGKPDVEQVPVESAVPSPTEEPKVEVPVEVEEDAHDPKPVEDTAPITPAETDIAEDVGNGSESKLTAEEMETYLEALTKALEDLSPILNRN